MAWPCTQISCLRYDMLVITHSVAVYWDILFRYDWMVHMKIHHAASTTCIPPCHEFYVIIRYNFTIKLLKLLHSQNVTILILYSACILTFWNLFIGCYPGNSRNSIHHLPVPCHSVIRESLQVCNNGRTHKKSLQVIHC